ncbi:hypothetical protein FOZ63_022310, partial [Perkinsus olseni]
LELSTTKMRSAIGHRRLAHIREFVSMSKQPLLKRTSLDSYDEQLGALTDHLCQMQQLVEGKEGLVNQTLEHRIYCGRCGCWNQLKSLVSGGGQCSLCGGRVLVLGWVEAPPDAVGDENTAPALSPSS